MDSVSNEIVESQEIPSENKPEIEKQKSELKLFQLIKGKYGRHKLISLLLLTVGVLMIIISTVLLETSFYSHKNKACKEIKNARDNKQSIFEVNTCFRKQCNFNTLTCNNPCPFGYHIDEDGCMDSCVCGEEGVFEGDILFDSTSLPQLMQLYTKTENSQVENKVDLNNRKWPKRENGRIFVPFNFEYEDKQLQDVVFDIAKVISNMTCIDLKNIDQEEITKHKTFVQFSKGTDKLNCGTSIGFNSGPDIEQGWPQHIYTSQYCNTYSILSHLILHKLGMLHEQSRMDRDSYVNIQWDHIIKDKQSEFNKRSYEGTYDKMYEYDINSIMHYPDTVFSTGTSKTITKYNRDLIAPAFEPSKTDFAKLSSFYECGNEGKLSANLGTWTDWSTTLSCSKACGTGFSKSWRKCLDSDGNYVFNCKGESYKKELCNTEDCLGKLQSWTVWSTCSKTCGKCGVMTRHRKCSEERECGTELSNFFQFKSCNDFICSSGINVKSKSKWTTWEEWSTCFKDDSNNELKTRERICISNNEDRSTQCLVDNNDLTLSFKESGKNKGKQIETISCNQNSRYSMDDKTLRLIKQPRILSAQLTEKNTNFPKSAVDYFSNNVASITDTPCEKFQSNVEWYFADFTGDLINDILCWDVDGKYEIMKSSNAGQLTATELKGIMRNCEKKYFGDFNGDGKHDLLCRNNGQLSFMLMAEDGFTNGPILIGEYCVGQDDVIILLDSNGDKKVDIGCVYQDNKFGIRENNYH